MEEIAEFSKEMPSLGGKNKSGQLKTRVAGIAELDLNQSQSLETNTLDLWITRI